MRKCNSLLLGDAIAKIQPIIFARNHPVYQRILYFNARDRVVMPNEIKSKHQTETNTNKSFHYFNMFSVLEKVSNY